VQALNETAIKQHFTAFEKLGQEYVRGTIEYTKKSGPCMSTERSVSRDGDKVYLDEENDGWTYMNRSPEAGRAEIVSADEKGLQLVDGVGLPIRLKFGPVRLKFWPYKPEVVQTRNGRGGSSPLHNSPLFPILAFAIAFLL
jgi:hypothetical protein